VVVDLTVEGEKRVKEVERAIFSYLRLLREEDIPDYIIDECQKLNDIAWRFQVATG